MNLEPKALNNSNHGYGYKEFSHSWEASLNLVFGGGGFRSIKEYLDGGGYSLAIDDALKHINRFTTIGSLTNLDEANLASFFMLGEAYLETGNIDNAIGAFHVVYSQIGFTQHMLKGPVDFAQYCYHAKEYLEGLAEKEGIEKVSNYDVESFLKNVVGKSSGGCFIATAACGSRYAEEIIVLQEFRDKYLLEHSLGKIFVKLYYLVSPPIANLISKRNLLKIITKNVLIIPLVKFARNLMEKEK